MKFKNTLMLLLFVALLASCKSKKQTVTSKKPPRISMVNATEAYIKKYKKIAIEEMHKYKIPASITLAQGILESSSGRSLLTRKSNNHFGIKCHKGWRGKKVYHDDDAKGECFRKYRDPKKSFRDHSLFLANRTRYAKLFKLKKGDYVGWAKGLSKAGYATDRRYPAKLIALIEKYKLYKYDGKRARKNAFKTHSKKNTKTKGNKHTHLVKKGETLYAISKKYGLSVALLKKINKLYSNEISVGQRLKILK